LDYIFFGGKNMAWTSAHVRLGELENGLKLYMTTITPDSGAATAVTISHLKTVLAYFPGIVHPGTTPQTFGFALTAGNVITVTPSGNPIAGSSIRVMSVGV
jgi:hypothetical protein